MEEWVYAVLAVLRHLGAEGERLIYLHHLRTYFQQMALVECSIPTEAGLGTCIQSCAPFSQIYRRAFGEIQALFDAILESVREPKVYPTASQTQQGRKFGCLMSLYSLGSFRLYAVYRKDLYLVRSQSLLFSCSPTDIIELGISSCNKRRPGYVAESSVRAGQWTGGEITGIDTQLHGTLLRNLREQGSDCDERIHEDWEPTRMARTALLNKRPGSYAIYFPSSSSNTQDLCSRYYLVVILYMYRLARPRVVLILKISLPFADGLRFLPIWCLTYYGMVLVDAQNYLALSRPDSPNS
ncbi:hypothetical protein B0H14DRAFT_1312831 [Mycena olivaceomarginata]|nr:hypothetical protein B0H14DRAFT_1312831 [Mycena olivaceomarginata]